MRALAARIWVVAALSPFLGCGQEPTSSITTEALGDRPAPGQGMELTASSSLEAYLGSKVGRWVSVPGSDVATLAISCKESGYRLTMQISGANGVPVDLGFWVTKAASGYQLTTVSGPGTDRLHIMGFNPSTPDVYVLNAHSMYGNLSFANGASAIAIYDQEHVGNGWIAVRFIAGNSTQKFVFMRVPE